MEGSLAQGTLWFSLFLYPHIPALWLFFNYSLMIKDVDSGGRQTWLPSSSASYQLCDLGQGPQFVHL